MFNKSPLIRQTVAKAGAVIAALGVAILLSGCVIVPAGPYYYHPHHYWGY